MFCRNCGTDVTDMKYCPKCGTLVEADYTVQNERNSKFDTFMYKTFYANGKLSYECAGNGYIAGILIIQILQFIFTLLNIANFSLTSVNLLFILLDWYSLSKRGIKGVWKIWGLLITPVYLWIRARKTDRKYIPAIISTAIIVLAIILTLMVL